MSESDRLGIEVASQGPDEAVLRLTGDLDMVTAPSLRAELGRHVDEGRRVVLDLSAIAFVDSTGLVLLMESARDSGRARASIVLRRDVSPSVARLLQVTKTEGLFAWVD